MPELPEVLLYLHALEPRTVGRTLEKVRVRSPSLLRTYDPPLSAVNGRRVVALRHVGKRVVFDLDDELFLSIHLMISGRFRWNDTRGAAIPGKVGHAAFDFDSGTLLLVEAATKKRAALHVVRGVAALAELDRGGIDPLGATFAEFVAALTRENHTVKRALTDPRLISGIGNAYSDEILHAARLSPLKLTRALSDADVVRLYDAMHATLTTWVERLRSETSGGFPEKVTAFHDAMAVHGRYNKPCPVCQSPVQRIVYAANECNYCARCQNEGRRLADRAMSRLLKEDWPRELDSTD